MCDQTFYRRKRNNYSRRPLYKHFGSSCGQIYLINNQLSSICIHTLWANLSTENIGKKAPFSTFNRSTVFSKFRNSLRNDLRVITRLLVFDVPFHGNLWCCLYQSYLGLPIWNSPCQLVSFAKHNALGSFGDIYTYSSFSYWSFGAQ